MWYRSRTIISMVTVTLGLAFPLAACAGGSGGAEEQPSPTRIASSSAQAAPAPSPPAVPSARPQARFNTTEVGGFAFAAGSAWMADGATLLRIDPHTNQTI